MKRELNTKESVRTVTSNQFITACGLEGISLKARKLLYIAISQSKKTDTEFYEYEIGVKEFADLMGIAPTHVYQEADVVTDELMRGFVKIQEKIINHGENINYLICVNIQKMVVSDLR